MTIINFGSEKEFLNVDGTFYNSIGVLSVSKVVVGYQDNFDSKHGTVKIGTISGTDIIFGTETEFFNQNGFDNALSIIVLDESTFIVEYQDESDSGHGTVRVGNVSGTSVVFGSNIEYESDGRAAWVSIATLDATHFVVVYADWSDGRKGKAKIGTVSGTSVAFGSASVFYPLNEATTMSVTSLDASGFIVSYRKGNVGDLQGAIRVGTVSGTDITFGDETEFTNLVDNTRDAISVDTFNSSKFVLAYKDVGDSNHGTVKIGTVSGTSITLGTETEFLSTDGILENMVRVLDSSHFVVAYKDGFDSNHGTVKIGTVVDIDSTFSNESEFLSADGSDYISLSVLNTNKFIVAYTDLSDSNHGTIKIGIIDYEIGSVEVGVPLRIIHRLVKTGDYNPQLVSSFNNASISVNIEVWDIVNGQNTKVIIANSGCYTIDNTNRWGWSTENLPFTQGHKRYNYYFRMTSDIGEEQYGEFFIAVPERGRWSHPD